MRSLDQLEIPGRVSLVDGEGGLRKIVVESLDAAAEIYLHGAHVTRFEKKGEPPLLFMSEASEFSHQKPIRGGVPVIFPWFGLREGLPAHGHARTGEWDWIETSLLPDESVSLRFRLPRHEDFNVEYVIIVGKELTLELIIDHLGESAVEFETCLHTYFQISAIEAISIKGLSNCGFFDKLTNTRALESAPELRIGSEVDRVYQDTTATVEILDPGYERTIRIGKSGSNSTVVWNPWIDKSSRMPDFGDEEYLRMVCVESGNVGPNKIILPAGGRSVMKVAISSEKFV
ncbi:MAG: D-hexose-6-phosphate mutarotase [Luteolibacter sp.]